jgi:uncharacterized protein YjbI with pentapeptide repeats
MDELVRSPMIHDARALPQQAGSTLPDPKPAALEAMKKAIDDAAAISGGIWLSYLFVLFYIGIAAGAVTHVDLLLQRPVNLPFLNTQLPLLAFFALAPFLFVVTHAYTLAHFVMLGKKASRFHEQLECEPLDPKSGASSEECDRHRHNLPCNIFVQILAGPPEMRGGLFGFVLKTIAVTTLIVFPVLLLLLLQSQFLPYHSAGITWAQRIALILDIALLWALRPPILAAPRRDGAVRNYVVRGYLVVAAVLSVAAVWLSVVIAVFPGEWQDKVLARLDPEWWPDIWSDGKKAAKRISTRQLLYNPPVSDTTLRPRGPFSRRLVLIAVSLYQELKIDEPAKLKWKEYLVELRDRNLEEAELSRADLRKADLVGANLQGAYLDGTQLQGAMLDGAQLQGASLRGARLEAASLDYAQLQGASLRGARLKAASLDRAQLQGALLDSAQLQAASLKSAKLQGAQLSDAELQGVAFDGAEVEAANFSGSFLWRTTGAGVHPRTIEFEKVNFEPNGWLKAPETDLATNDLTFSPSFEPKKIRPHLPDDITKYYWYLAPSLESEAPAMLEDIKRRAERFDCKHPLDGLESCDAAKAKKPPHQVKEWHDALNKASVKDAASQAAYQKALAEILKKLLCESGDGAIYVLRVLRFENRFGAIGSEPSPSLIPSWTGFVRFPARCPAKTWPGSSPSAATSTAKKASLTAPSPTIPMRSRSLQPQEDMIIAALLTKINPEMTPIVLPILPWQSTTIPRRSRSSRKMQTLTESVAMLTQASATFPMPSLTTPR